MKNKAIIIITVVAILAVGTYAAIDRIAVYALSRVFNLEIKYSGLKRSGITQFTFRRLTCVDKARGFGVSADEALIKPDFRSMAVDFDLQGVRFVKKTSDRMAPIDSLSKIVEEPFTGNWNYMKMSGSVKPIRGGVEMTRFEAAGDNMKLKMDGSVLESGPIEAVINISFSAESAKKIPAELASVLLSDEDGGWKTVSVNLSGNYRSPSIQVTGKMFRLSVKEIVEVK